LIVQQRTEEGLANLDTGHYTVKYIRIAVDILWACASLLFH